MIRYSRSSSQTPVWVTSQALLALARKPLPFRAPGRAADHRRAAAVATGSGHATRKRHARTAAKPSTEPEPNPASPASPPRPTARSTRWLGARSESRSPGDRNGSDPWLLELASATLPIVVLAIWRRRWLRRPLSIGDIAVGELFRTIL